ncbi:MAG: hypothetical protein KC502_03390 [Myxococcales bacterium]|nr:hypothetical protein [Myxococcales bacterium]
MTSPLRHPLVFLLSFVWLVPAACFAAQSQPIPRKNGSVAKKQLTGKRPTSEQTGKEADATEGKPVDWRGLDRMDADGRTKRKDKPPPNPVQQLVQNAPYRVHVATTNGKKVTITDAYTLERRRIFVADAIVGYAFSWDGHWLYIVSGTANLRTVHAVAVNTAKARSLGRVTLRKGEHVVEVLGRGKADGVSVAVVIARGKPWQLGTGCKKARRVRRVRFVQRRGKLVREALEGPHERKFPYRSRRVSPNTRYTVELAGTLNIHGRFGGGGKVERLNKKGLPANSGSVRWMRDSRGVFVIHRRKGACPHLRGLATFRQPLSQYASWRRQRNWADWRVPGDVQLTRGDLAHQDLSWSPDGMRLVGVTAKGVVLVEPVIRYGKRVALIAPPSTLWPAVRPGVRSLVTGASALRHSEILLEQGNLTAAKERLAKAPKGVEQARLLKRLAKLQRVRLRRLREFGLARPPAPIAPSPTPATRAP